MNLGELERQLAITHPAVSGISALRPVKKNNRHRAELLYRRRGTTRGPTTSYILYPRYCWVTFFFFPISTSNKRVTEPNDCTAAAVVVLIEARCLVVGGMLAFKLLGVLCVTSARRAHGLQLGAVFRTSSRHISNGDVTATWRHRHHGRLHRIFTRRRTQPHRPTNNECIALQRRDLPLRTPLLGKRWSRPSPNQRSTEPRSTLLIAGQGHGTAQTLPREDVDHSGALVALPMLGRLFGQATNLFQVGALFGTIPTLLAGMVCCYWAWQVSECWMTLSLCIILLHSYICLLAECPLAVQSP